MINGHGTHSFRDLATIGLVMNQQLKLKILQLRSRRFSNKPDGTQYFYLDILNHNLFFGLTEFQFLKRLEINAVAATCDFFKYVKRGCRAPPVGSSTAPWWVRLTWFSPPYPGDRNQCHRCWAFQLMGFRCIFLSNEKGVGSTDDASWLIWLIVCIYLLYLFHVEFSLWWFSSGSRFRKEAAYRAESLSADFGVKFLGDPALKIPLCSLPAAVARGCCEGP